MYTEPLPWTGSDTKYILKGNKASLNSKFSFSKTGYLTKAKEPTLLYLPIPRSMYLFFSQKRQEKWGQSRSGFELESLFPFLSTITVTLTASRLVL